MQVKNINNTQLLNNKKNTSFKGGRELVRLFANPDSLATTVALETSVTGGRGINAYKRGGKNEFRERFTDDVVSAVFWMKGVDIFNKIGNSIGKNVLNLPTTEFDVGKDQLRTPFQNLEASLKDKWKLPNEAAVKDMSKKLAVFKFTKIAVSSILATAFVGFALPKINQWITERIMGRHKMENKLQEESKPIPFKKSVSNTFEDFDKKTNVSNQPSFKGLNLLTVAHALENHKIIKMMTTDVGILTGRVTTARNKDEAREYLFRDTMSPIFYYASTPIIYKGLQLLTGKEKSTNIDPVAAKQLHDNIITQLGKTADGKMTVEEFQKKVMGTLDDGAKEIMAKLPFGKDKQVISLAELKKVVTDKRILKKAEYMSKLQPEQAGVGAVLTKQQMEDVLKKGSINTPNFMKKMFKGKFGEALTNPLKFIPMKKITKFRQHIDEYGQAVVETAKKTNGGIIDKDLLTKLNKNSFAASASFRAVAMGISALALGVIIPKLQYAMTARRTGSNAAPGLRQFEEEKKA